jgi:hypothetical protein
MMEIETKALGIISLMFTISKPADLNYKAQGGQLYRAFHFRKGSLIGRKETTSTMMLQCQMESLTTHNRTHIRHQCRKTTILSCHRCLTNTGVKKEHHLNID